MSDSIKGLVITFEEDIGEGQAKMIMDAIRQIRGVIDVSPSVVDIHDHINRMRIETEIKMRMHNAIWLGDKK